MYTKHIFWSPFAKKKKQQQLTPDQNGKIEEQNIVDSYTSENST
jgi:hypothetical protein